MSVTQLSERNKTLRELWDAKEAAKAAWDSAFSKKGKGTPDEQFEAETNADRLYWKMIAAQEEYSKALRNSMAEGE